MKWCVYVCVQVRKMKMISPTNREVDIGQVRGVVPRSSGGPAHTVSMQCTWLTGCCASSLQTLKPDEYIGMTRREVLDGFLRQRAINNGAQAINGLVRTPTHRHPQGHAKLPPQLN
jgi:hypothetical protein